MLITPEGDWSLAPGLTLELRRADQGAPFNQPVFPLFGQNGSQLSPDVLCLVNRNHKLLRRFVDNVITEVGPFLPLFSPTRSPLKQTEERCPVQRTERQFEKLWWSRSNLRVTALEAAESKLNLEL